MGLRPAAIVMRADQHHGDVELAFFDLRDLEAARSRRGFGRGRGASVAAGAGGCRRAAGDAPRKPLSPTQVTIANSGLPATSRCRRMHLHPPCDITSFS